MDRARIELYADPSGGWRYRVKARNSEVVEESEQSLKQFTYALRRARRSHPDLHAYRVGIDGKLILLPDPAPEA